MAKKNTNTQEQISGEQPVEIKQEEVVEKKTETKKVAAPKICVA